MPRSRRTNDSARMSTNCCSDNPQYAYARQIGQLHELDVIFAPGFAQHRARVLTMRGQRLGDAKCCALILDRSQLPSHSRVRH